MKTRKILAAILSASMLMGSMGTITGFADTGSTVVYNYIDENGTEVNITQADLDAAHWNKDALGDVAPIIYNDFPAKMEGYVNDFGELTLDITYLKKIADMDNVNLKIESFADDTVIYNSSITQTQFYSPILQEGSQYKVTLTETLNDVDTEYIKVVNVIRTVPQMPEYVTNPTAQDDNTILIANVETLRAGTSVNEEGQTVINASVAKYDKVEACDFNQYCNTLSDNAVYRLYTNDDDNTYAGFLTVNNGVKDIYTFEADTFSLEDMYAPSVASLPTYTLNDVMDNAVRMTIKDECFRLTDNSNSSKYVAYEVSVPDSYVSSDEKSGTFRITVTGSQKIAMKIWKDLDNGSVNFVRTYISSNSENTTTYQFSVSDYARPLSYLSFYIMIYCPDTISDKAYGIINFEAVPGTGCDDDVTGSIAEAYYGASSYYSLTNTEFSMKDSWDVDAFCVDYWGDTTKIYKFELKNRSLAEQALIESGQSLPGGGNAKYMTFWNITERSNIVTWSDTATYSIASNTDCVVYADASNGSVDAVTINNQGTGSNTEKMYQFAFAPVQ